MGMFDSIWFKCKKCGADIEAQSKSGECILANYDYTEVPTDVAEDANRHAPFVCKCGKRYEFREIPAKTISLEIVQLN
ncbi:MAG: hypothetical protein NUV80_00820 [Candidatus Berkelbacteria bacterium]|nr:hypothetical protein [Candidatus Berkelbacteria bacterium]